MIHPARAFSIFVLVACGDDAAPPEGGTTAPDEGTTAADESTTAADESTTAPDGTTAADTEDTGGPACESVGTPEMTGPVTGLQGSYAAGDAIDVGVPVDEDTARVIVGIYEVGSELYLGGTAEDVDGPTTATLSFFAGVAGGETGEFYLSIELCSTSVCTPPFVRNTYDRVDRTALLGDGETYVQTRELVGGDGTPEACETEIPIQSFLIQ